MVGLAFYCCRLTRGHEFFPGGDMASKTRIVPVSADCREFARSIPESFFFLLGVSLRELGGEVEEEHLGFLMLLGRLDRPVLVDVDVEELTPAYLRIHEVAHDLVHWPIF